ncbi:hypothetical protein Tco_1310049 [Tanacetum coccineum]
MSNKSSILGKGKRFFTVASIGWPFVFVVPGQMTHLVAKSDKLQCKVLVVVGDHYLLLLLCYGILVGVVVGKVSSIIKLSFVTLVPCIELCLVLTIKPREYGVLSLPYSNRLANEFHQDKDSSVRVPVTNFTLKFLSLHGRQLVLPELGNNISN